MSRFKERLWRELVREHGEALSRTPPSQAHHRWRARPRILVGAGVGLAGLGATLALVLGAAATSPAFAVTRNHDGTVSVAIHKWSAIPAANARLRKMGIRAELAPAPAACVVVQSLAPGMTKALAAARANVVHVKQARINVQARFDPKQIPVGKLLVIRSLRIHRAFAPGNFTGKVRPGCMAVIVPPCAVLTAPGRLIKVPPPGNARNSGSSGNSGKSGNSGNSGKAGKSGNSGNSGNSVVQVPAPAPAGSTMALKAAQAPVACAAPPPPTGNSGNSGDSGNSGSGKSGNTGNS